MFDAILTGDIGNLESGREIFRAYAYLLNLDGSLIHAWPPFLIAQPSVLGKNRRNLCAVLESSELNQPKAFKALAQLAVILQLMCTGKGVTCVPRHSKVTQQNALDATAIFEVGSEARNIEDLRQAVDAKFSGEEKTLQVVVIPLYAEFPIYDFFLFHRNNDVFRRQKWKIAAGYQCKMGTKYPNKEHRAAREVSKSVWIEGRSPISRAQPGNDHHGWQLLSRGQHQKLLGVSLFAALPLDDMEDDECDHCRVKGDAQ